MEEVRLGDISPPRPRVLFGEEATATINEGSSGSRSVNSPPRKLRKVPNSVRRQFSKKWPLAHHYFEHGDEDWDLLNGVFGLLEDLCAYPGENEDDDARLIQRHNHLLHFIVEENATQSTGSNSVEGFEKRRQSNPTKAPGSSSKYYPVDGLSDRESCVGPVDSYMHWVRNLGSERSEEEETTLASDARWNDRQ